jgi:transposase
MISIGIDISKDKSTICALKSGSETIWKPFDLKHLQSDMQSFISKLEALTGELRIVMEATGKYHLPILYSLKSKGYFVTVVNPLKMKQFCRSMSFRKAKNDNIDSRLIAEYGLIYWHKLEEYKLDREVYQNLKYLNRSYHHYMDLRISQMNFLDTFIDQVFPGLKKILPHGSGDFSKDKLLDFLEVWWHKDVVISQDEEEFIKVYQKWAKEKRYHPNAKKAQAIYEVALEGISTQPSNSPYIKADVYESIQLVKRINQSLNCILSQMLDLAEPLEEFQEAKKFSGISDKLAVQITAEFGDLSKFRNKKCLISFVGIDAPTYICYV